MILEIILLIFFFFFILVILGFILFSIFHLFFWIKSGTPFLSSNEKLLKEVEKEIDWRGVKNFYDLGSGNGNVIRFLASDHKDISFIGYEINPFRVWISNWLSRHLDNVKFESCDFLKKDLSRADIVFTFLLPKAMDSLLSKLKKEMPKGSLLVSNTFNFTDKSLKPEKIINPGKEKEFQTLYIFKF